MPKDEWIIGRSSECDIVIDQPEISNRHCRLARTADGLLLEDLRSRNGTFVNGARITSARLVTPSDQVTLGPSVPFVWPGGMVGSSGSAPMEGRTPRSPAMGTIGIRAEGLVFGRDVSCDQVLDDPMISHRHARVLRRGDRLFLEDLGSANGTFLNGIRIDKPVAMRPGDEIALGNYSYRLTDESLLEKSDGRQHVTLEARGICVDVPGKRLLHRVSLTIFPAEFVGLMGPSGAGKTTLMSALNGYTRPSSGDVWLNGCNLYAHYARFSLCLGYVPQDDVIHRDLTVGQALYYSARLRLPSDYSEAEVAERIRRVLRQLGLKGTENVLIGSAERKGISGGQRKRVNLAMELLTDPVILFLDEPTSGLSSEDALTVMRLLRELSNGGKTILLTIHQPSPEVFRLLDNLVVVSRDRGARTPGVLAYYGPAYPDAVDFFNPEGIADLRPGMEPLPDEVLRGLARKPAAEWAARYRDSPYFTAFVSGRARRQRHQPSESPGSRRRLADPVRQWWTLVRRTLAIKAKDKWNTAILLLQAPVIAGLVVLVFGGEIPSVVTAENWQQVAKDMPIAVFLLALSALWFGCSNAVRDIVGEWPVYRRERMVNLRIGCYVASKLTVLGALCGVQCAVLLAIIHLGCNLAGPWLPMFGVLWLVAIVGVTYGLILSALARSSEVAIALLPLILLPMVILGGVMQPLPKMNSVVRAVAQSAAARWAFEGLLLLESDSRPAFQLPAGAAKAAPAAPETRIRDMADRYFPAGEHRVGVLASVLALATLFAVGTATIGLILKIRDLH